MPQFDVYRSPRSATFPLVVDVQHDLLARLETRVVVPMATLSKFGSKPITRLNPTVKIDRVEYVLVVQELAAIPLSALTKRVTSIASQRDAIVAAFDLLVTGI